MHLQESHQPHRLFPMIIIYFTLSSFITFNTVTAQHIETGLCDQRCVCISHPERIVACNQVDKLQGLPTNVPIKYHRLSISKSPFPSPSVLRPGNMTGLEHLKYLKIIYCELEGVEPFTFSKLTNLNYLDLSHNRLKIIEPATFSGLRLNSLHLMENPGIELRLGSFQNLHVIELNLRSNHIKHISSIQFRELGLKKLYLFNNSLTQLDRGMSALFSRPGNFLDLTSNPLHCDCRLKWLVLNLRQQPIEKIKHINITCATPAALAHRSLLQITDLDELECVQPRIDSLSIDIGMSQTQLSCSTISQYRDTEISWTYEEEGQQKVFRKKPESSFSPSPYYSSNEQNPPLQSDLNYRQYNNIHLFDIKSRKMRSSFSVNVTIPSNQQRSFICSTWLRDETLNFDQVTRKSQKVVVQIKTPPLFDTNEMGNYPTQMPNDNNNNNNNNNNNDDNNNKPSTNIITQQNKDETFLFRKQFTILEMIGAVVGTFTVTIFLLLLAVNLIKSYRYHLMKSTASLKPYLTHNNHNNNNSSSNSNYNHNIHNNTAINSNTKCNYRMYPSQSSRQHHDSSTTYSQPASQNGCEYDIPRFCETHTFPAPPTFDHIEFLDFKNPQKLYPPTPS